ncbi:MAG: beta-galactosidase GalB, partial [Lacunisphaera sp.]
MSASSASLPTATRLRCLVVSVIVILFVASGHSAERTRESFNRDWRFTRGDPAGLTVALDYAAARPWLLPMGAELLNGADHPSKRPAANFGDGVSYRDFSFDDRTWRALDLPHDWAIEGPFDQSLSGETGKLPWAGIGWYRKHFTTPRLDGGQRLTLQFDGAMENALVWCNGIFVGGWPYGYTSWQVDLTDAVRPGADNVIAVRLDNLSDSSRWYPGSGLYRNTWLETTPPIHLAPWGVAVTTPEISTDAALVNVAVEICDDTGNVEDMKIKQKVWENDPSLHELLVRHRIFLADDAGRPVGEPMAFGESAPVGIHDGYRALATATLTVPHPQLWDLTHPVRYVLETTVSAAGKIVDRAQTPFGIRSAVFTADRGFLLNGKVVRLQGVCLHHDLGALGAATNTSAWERRLRLLKAMGCNAIRTSHNPPAPELLDLCDRLGFVVMDEAFDSWEVAKKPNGYNLRFVEWHEKDLKAMIRRDRNHPSVVLWSIGNEVGEQTFPEAWHWGRRLTALAHEEDPSRPTTSAFCVDNAAAIGLQTTVDVMGFNYRPYLYADFHHRHPLQPLVGTETASTVSTRGDYFFPISENKLHGLADFQVSSYDLSAGDWATLPDVEFRGQDENPSVAGEFVWTGFDYLGEPTPYLDVMTTLPVMSYPVAQKEKAREFAATGKVAVPSRSSYFGILDLAGFPKDRYYLYQARWRPDLPMAHILPHWNWPERVGQVTPVHVYSSGDEAELFLNGKSLGRKKRGTFEYRFRWDEVVYEPGQLKVVVYKNGRPWTTAEES